MPTSPPPPAQQRPAEAHNGVFKAFAAQAGVQTPSDASE